MNSQYQYVLPSPSTEIIGRDREANELRTLLLADEVRLVTLTGPGGMGKTRLAIHVSSLMIDSFVDGVYFVPLAHISDPALFFLTLAQSLTIQSEPAQPVQQPVLHYFRQREVLLVLDNFEQIVSAAADVALLLASCPQLTILVTSRIVLRIRGEYEYPVLPLALPAINASMEVDALSHYAAVLLFVQRATAVRPDFRLTVSNAAAIAEICLRLDGLPLAIELAAARTKLLTPQAMLPRLQHRLQLLRGGAVDLPERQQTLYNTIAWSYELLDGMEQEMFRSLAVFQGYWSLEAATVVLQKDEMEVEEAVLSLVDKSMVQQREMPNGDIFFTLLETLREFALEKLSATDNAVALHERHIDYYTTLAASHTLSIPDREHQRWVENVTSSFDNMRAAFYWALRNERVDKAARLFVALSSFWFIRYAAEGNMWLEQLRPFIDSLPADIKYLVYYRSGFFRCERGEIQAALDDSQRALELLPAEKADMRVTLFPLLALNYHLSGAIDKAEEMYLEAIAYFRTNGKFDSLAGTLPAYSGLLQNTGRVSTAITLLEEAIELMYTHELRRNLPMLLIALAPLYGATDMDKVQSVAEEGLALCREFGDQRNEFKACNTLAGVALSRNEYATAGQYLYTSLQRMSEIGNYRSSPPILLNLVSVLLSTSAVEEAARLFAYTDNLLQSLEGYSILMFTEFHESLLEQLSEKIDPLRFEQLRFESRELSPAALHTLVRSALEHYVFPTATEPSGVVSTGAVFANPEVPYELTGREREILALLAQGLSNKEIGERLFISMRTVHAHVRSIYSKINVNSRSAATRFAMENGM
jgi:predicted ATPase/DNA-binding CsgD family transcriptional regulator